MVEPKKWDDLKFDCYRHLRSTGLHISEYLLDKHGVDVPVKRNEDIKSIVVTGVPVIFNWDDAKEYVRKHTKGEINDLIPHYYTGLRSDWQCIDESRCWRRNGKDCDGSIGIAAVVSDAVGVPMMFNMTAYQDAAKLSGYLLYKYKLTVSALKYTKECPEFIKSRWKEFKWMANQQFKKL